jgi:hypothetical protein
VILLLDRSDPKIVEYWLVTLPWQTLSKQSLLHMVHRWFPHNKTLVPQSRLIVGYQEWVHHVVVYLLRQLAAKIDFHLAFLPLSGTQAASGEDD